MKKGSVTLVSVFLIISIFTLANFSIVLGTKALSEERITTDASAQHYPAIYGDIVVWYDERNGNYDIYGYNLNTKQEFPITTNTSGQYYPAIYCDRVVWEERRNANWDIYLAYLDVYCKTTKTLPIDKILKIVKENQQE
jgi:beta propeller repeat protein